MTYSTIVELVAVINSTANITTIIYAIDHPKDACVEERVSNESTELWQII